MSWKDSIKPGNLCPPDCPFLIDVYYLSATRHGPIKRKSWICLVVRNTPEQFRFDKPCGINKEEKQ